MAATAISVEGLGKRYRIGGGIELDRRLTESLTDAVTSPRATLRRRRAERESAMFWALKDLSFDVPRGSTLGVIGRNGAGKTTLLKVLARIADPTTGNARIVGRVASLLQVGAGFHPDLTGRENVYLNGAILGMRKREIERKFDEIVEFAEVTRFIETPVKRYSSGMYLRLAFAVAAHLEPDVLLVDEILAVGDLAFQRKCLGKMGEVAREGRTVLFVSHNLAAVDALCTTALVLDAGAAVYLGDVTEGIRRYAALVESGDGDRTRPHERVRLGHVRLASDGAVATGAPFELSFTVDVLGPGVQFDEAFVIIRDPSDTLVLRADLAGPDLGAIASPGGHSVSLSLPPLWMSPGTYSVYVKLLGRSENGTVRVVSDVVGFGVEGTPDGGYRSHGVLAPPLMWSIASAQSLGAS